MNRTAVSWAGRKVAVLGAARSGIAAANLLVELGAEVVLSDQRAVEDLALDGLHKRVRVVGGGNVIDGAGFVVPSPGIPPSAAIFARARDANAQLVSEIELAASVCQAPMVAITGTDGKTTTTEMVGAVVRAAGRSVAVGGNIGEPLSTKALNIGADGVLVAEVSAFQLWSCGVFKPQVAIVTNIAEDHAEYFKGDTAAYVRAKARVLDDMQPGTHAILRADDAVVWAMETPSGVVRVPFGLSTGVSDGPSARREGWGLVDGVITHDGAAVLDTCALQVPGVHNACNAMSALAAGVALGLPVEAMVEGLKAFKGLPHRLEPVRTLDGVTYYDDSKATNPHAAAAGLKALTAPVVAITGGYEKGLDLTPLVNALLGARAVVVTGHTAARTTEALAGRVQVVEAKDMQDAVEKAQKLAHSGDAVVLSPAASSFDHYRSYGHRGDVFQEVVRRL